MKIDSIKAETKDVKLAIATPCYGGQCSNYFSFSLYYLGSLLHELQIQNVLMMSSNESLITRARNRLVRMFLDTDATHLLFIDSDIQFKPFDVVRMLLHKKPVVCGSYPLKNIFLEDLADKPPMSLDEVKRTACRYVINLQPEDQHNISKTNEPVKISTEDGLVAIQDAGTGFMLIERHVIEKIIEAYPEIEYISECDQRTWYAVFDCIIDKESKRYLSEDYTFCRRWQALGGKVWLDTDIILDHIGSFKFDGYPMFFWEQPKPELLKTKA